MAHGLPFSEAVKRHHLLARVSPEHGTVVWPAISGEPGPGGLLAEASADTLPDRHAVRVAIDEAACALATSCLDTAFGDALPREPREARDAARRGWAQFQEIADSVEELRCGTGADQSAAWTMWLEARNQQIPEDELRRIAGLAGRMYESLRGQREKNARGLREEPVGVEDGNDLTRAVASELGLLGHQATSRYLALRVAERRLVQRDERGQQEKSRGPLVILLDESGSMRGADDRRVWAKAALAALTRIAWESKRPVSCVHFSTSIAVTDLAPGDWPALGRAIGHFLSGGTAIGRALYVGLKQVDVLARAGAPGADVVLLSDGGDAVGGLDAACDALDKRRVRLWSIAVLQPFSGALRDRAAEYVELSRADLQSTEGAKKIAGAVV